MGLDSSTLCTVSAVSIHSFTSSVQKEIVVWFTQKFANAVCSLSPLNVICCFINISIHVVARLLDRHTAGECSLLEETPPVMSQTSSPGRVLLLPDRHAGCPGTLGPLPQRGHQEEFHSLTPARSHFSLSRGSQWKGWARQQTLPQSKRRHVRRWEKIAGLPASFSGQ